MSPRKGSRIERERRANRTRTHNRRKSQDIPPLLRMRCEDCGGSYQRASGDRTRPHECYVERVNMKPERAA